jgi:Holliday junction resolvase RusA-like endonuclease
MPTSTTAKIILKGRPITKKNHQMIARNRRTGRPYVLQSKQYRQYEEDCLKQLMICRARFAGPVRMKCLYWMPNRRRPDLLGLLQATADILEKAQIIDNDRNVVSFDGSRIAGVDRENPRVEIEIESCEVV